MSRGIVSDDAAEPLALLSPIYFNGVTNSEASFIRI